MAIQLTPLPPREAIAALLRRGGRLDPSFSWLDAWQAEHAAMFTVAKSAGFDILTEIHAALVKALAEGTTIRDFARGLRPLLEEKGWWGRRLVEDPVTGDLVSAQLGSPRRLQIIFDTNMRVSYAAGHWASFERNKGRRPFLRYVAILDEATRPAHRAQHNICLPVDHPFWDTWAPPCGWNCRCTLQQLSQRDVDRLERDGEDLRFEAPPDTFRNFINRRTGEVTRVPDGIDPGWAYNPGKAGDAAVANQALAEKVAAAPPELMAAAIRDIVGGEAFARFIANPAGELPVMAVPTPIAEHGPARAFLLSSQTMAKQITEHPEITLDDYRQLPLIGETPTLILQEKENQFIIMRLSDGRWRFVAAKLTATGRAAYITSYRYHSADDIERLFRRRGIRILLDRRE